jgi:hypothetical protein
MNKLSESVIILSLIIICVHLQLMYAVILQKI